MFTNELFITVLAITSLLEATTKGKGVCLGYKLIRGGVFVLKLYLILEQQLVGKSFQKWTPVFDHFCLFWCKLARCFPKHLHFSPLVTLQRKSFQNLTPLPGHFLRRGKCANWSLDGGVSLHFTVRYLWNKAPRRKKSRGWIWVLWGWLPPGTVQLCPPVTKACIKQIVWSKLSIQHRP